MAFVLYPVWQGGTIRYKGTAYTVNTSTYWSNLTHVDEISGTYSATMPNTYEISFHLEAGYLYKNGEENYTTTWTINKLEQSNVSFSLNSSSVLEGGEFSGSWSGTIGGVPTKSYGTANCALAEEKGSTIKFTAGSAGNATVVAALSETTYYEAWQSAPCTITVTEPPLTEPTFKTSQLQYTGGEIAPTTSNLNNYDSSCMSFTCATHKAINTNYTATVSITSGTKTFPGGSTSVTLYWDIIKRNISGATITLATSPTYNGSEQEQAINSVSISGVSDTITYSVSGNKATNVKTDGNYSITLTGTGNFTGTASTTWNIQKASATISGFDTSSVKTVVFDYWTRSGTTNFGNIKYSASGSAVTVDENTGYVHCSSAGSSTVIATVSGTTNYTGASESYSVTVSKIDAYFDSGCEPSIQSSWTYDGITRYLFTSDGTPTPSRGTVYYCVKTTTSEPYYSDYSSSRLSFPQTKAGGPWYLWTYIDVDPYDSQYNYSDHIYLGSVQVYAGTPTIDTEPSAGGRQKYTGSSQKLEFTTGTANHGTLQYRYKDGEGKASDWVDGTTTFLYATDVETYTMYYRIVGEEGYSTTEEKYFGTVEIYKSAVGWSTWPKFASGKQYDGNSLALVTSKGTSTDSTYGVPVFYACKSTTKPAEPSIDSYTSDITAASLNPTNAGSYYVWYRVKSTNTSIKNHGSASCIDSPIVISKVPSSLTYADQSVYTYYSDEETYVKYSAAKNNVGQVTYKLRSDSAAGFSLDTDMYIKCEAGKAVGNYTLYIVAEDSGNDNYDSGSATSKVTYNVYDWQQVTVDPKPVLYSDFNYTGESETLVKTDGTVSPSGYIKYAWNDTGTLPPYNSFIFDKGDVAERLPGTYYVFAVGYPDQSATSQGYNYSNRISLGSVTIKKLVPEVDPKPIISSRFVYDMKPHDLCSEGSVVGGTLWYSSSTSGIVGEWLPDIPTGTELGTYYVWYKVIGAEGYEDISETPLGTVECFKGKVSWKNEPTYASGLVFNSTFQNLITNGGSGAGGDPVFCLKSKSTDTPLDSDYKTLAVQPIQAYNAGTYYVWQKVKSNISYRDDSAAAQITVTIAKASNPITYAGQTISYTYHPTANYTHALAKATNTVGTVTYSLKSGTPDIFWIDDKNNLICKAGTVPSSSCTIYVIASDDGGSAGNYEAGSDESTTMVIIGKAESSIAFSGTAISTDFSYSSKALSFTAATESAGTPSYSIKSQKDSKEQTVNYFSIPTATTNTLQMAARTPVGAYTVIVTASDPGNDNYKSGTAEASINVSVVKASCVFWTPTDPKKDYDGTNQFVGLIVQSPPVEKVKIDYTINGSASTPVINAGTYTVAYTISDTDGNFIPESGTYNLTVSKRYTKMRSTGGNMEFGDAVPTLSAWIDEETPLVHEGDLGELKPSNIITSESDANKDYTTMVTYTGNDNYNVEELFGAIHMNPYVITSRPKLINGKDEISTWVYNGTSKARDYYVAPTFKKDKYVDITNFLNYIDKVTADNYSILYQIPSTYFGNVKWSGTDSDTITLDWSITKCMSFSLSIYNPTSMSEHDAGTTDTLQYSHSIEFVDASQVSISSSNPSVVAIDSSGNISYLSKGTADLTVAVVDNVNHVANSSTVRVVVKANDSIVYIYHNGEFVPAIPYIYTNGQWREARAILYSNGKWNPQ